MLESCDKNRAQNYRRRVENTPKLTFVCGSDRRKPIFTAGLGGGKLATKGN